MPIQRLVRVMSGGEWTGVEANRRVEPSEDAHWGYDPGEVSFFQRHPAPPGWIQDYVDLCFERGHDEAHLVLVEFAEGGGTRIEPDVSPVPGHVVYRGPLIEGEDGARIEHLRVFTRPL